jgi:hypothetical protein
MITERVSAALKQAERVAAAREKLEKALAELEIAVAAQPVAKPNGRALPERLCRNDNCRRPFVPESSRQFFCKPRCTRAHNERKRIAKRREAEAKAQPEAAPFSS